MQHAGSKREPLLPSAGEFARQLCLPLLQPKPLDGVINALLSVVELIDVRDELQIFADRQILPEAELLGHVTNLPLDLFRLRDDVVAEAGTAARIGTQQS